MQHTVPVPGQTLRPRRVAPRVRKGDVTRAAIVEAALTLAGRLGLEGLTIGAVAEAMHMSKSGVMAHFGSREQLQLAVLDAYGQSFIASVLRPCLALPRGLLRLRGIVEIWLRYLTRALDCGCLLVGGASEYDDREGPVHDAMVAQVAGWQSELVKAIDFAIHEGHLREDVDAWQLAFELYGVMLALHQAVRLLRASDAVHRARASIYRVLAASVTRKGAALLDLPPPRLHVGSLFV